MSMEQSADYQYRKEHQAKESYEDDANYNGDDGGGDGQADAEYDSTWLPEESQFGPLEDELLEDRPSDPCGPRERSCTAQESKGFVSRGRMHDRHVPPRDFPHPQPNDPQLARSPVYGRQQSPQPSNARNWGEGSTTRQVLDYPADDDDAYPSYYVEPENDLAVPEYPMPPLATRPFHPNIRAAVDKSLYDEIELPSARLLVEASSSSGYFSQPAPPHRRELGAGGPSPVHNKKVEEFEGSQDSLPLWCDEHRGEESGDIEFGVVGSVTEIFWPKPGDILILANERKGCKWPAFDGHLEIYVDDDYFSKSSVALQWNYTFRNGDIVLRFGDFDRHWRWRANNHIHVFLRDNEVFYLVARQAAQELHPLDFRFVDPRQRPVHTVQYHLQPRVGDFILRKGSDDSYLWNTSWWHPGGDSHLLLKHLKKSYPQGPDPKYRWTCHWYKRGFKFRPEDVLLRVGYESAEDNVHCYCVCEIYFRGDGLWTFQGRDDFSFGPPSHS